MEKSKYFNHQMPLCYTSYFSTIIWNIVLIFFLCLEKSSTFLETLNLKSDMETVGEISIKDLLKQTKIRVYRMNHYPDSKNRAK